MTRKLSEAQFQRQVLELARFTGWRSAHFRTSRGNRGNYLTAVAGDGAGFPDLVLIRDRVIFRELKTDSGKLSPEQIAWGEALIAAGADFAVWRPADWRNIEVTLTSRVNLTATAGP